MGLLGWAPMRLIGILGRGYLLLMIQGVGVSLSALYGEEHE